MEAASKVSTPDKKALLHLQKSFLLFLLPASKGCAAGVTGLRRDLLTRRERGEKIQDAGFCVEQRWKPQRLPRPFPEARCLYRRRGGRCSACFAEVGIAIAQLSGDYVEDRLALSREAIEIKRGLLLS